MDLQEYIEITRSGDEIRFTEYRNGKAREIGSLKIEWNYLIGLFIRNAVPTEAEIEYCINYIEDELMSDPRFLNIKNFPLITADPAIREMLGPGIFSKEDIEEDFTPYALHSMGRSPVYDAVEPDNQRYILLLVIREILNHLQFENLEIF